MTKDIDVNITKVENGSTITIDYPYKDNGVTRDYKEFVASNNSNGDSYCTQFNNIIGKAIYDELPCDKSIDIHISIEI